MTLDEAIKHYEEKATELRERSDVLSETSTTPKGKEISDCLECAEEYEQLAEWLKDYKRLLEMPKGDLISREALKEHKFLSPQFKVIGGRRCGKTREQIIEAYQKGWNDCIDAIIDNAPTVPQCEWIPVSERLPEMLGVIPIYDCRSCKNNGNERECIDCHDFCNFVRYEESPQGEWIPVSERLPQNRDWYLGIFREVDTGWINPVPYICDYVGKETIGTTKAGWILKNITDEKYCAEYYKNLECICWQPLPVKPNIPDLEGGEEE